MARPKKTDPQLENYTKKLAYQRHDVNGNEMLNPVPLSPPLGYKKTPTLSEQIMHQVRQAKLQLLYDGDIDETDEEADDFDVGDDFEPLSQYENDHIPSIKVLKQRRDQINAQIQEANRRAAIAAHENALRKPASVTTPNINNLPDPKPIKKQSDE